MDIWSEKFELTEDMIAEWKKRYSSDLFLTVKENKEFGSHYTGYQRDFDKEELLSVYVPKLKEVLTKFGLSGMFSYSSIWAQYYKKEMGAKISPHDHFTEPKNMLSWIHFVDVPDQKCFYFLVGDQKIYPDTQSKSDLMFYPSYAVHGVDKLIGAEDRLVIVGNITKLL